MHERPRERNEAAPEEADGLRQRREQLVAQPLLAVAKEVSVVVEGELRQAASKVRHR